VWQAYVELACRVVLRVVAASQQLSQPSFFVSPRGPFPPRRKRDGSFFGKADVARALAALPSRPSSYIITVVLSKVVLESEVGKPPVVTLRSVRAHPDAFAAQHSRFLLLR